MIFYFFSYNKSIQKNVLVKNDEFRPIIVNFTLHTLKQSSGNLMYNIFFPRN